MHVVILAGGGGTRLWPLSRKDFPKQFLHLGRKESLLKQTVSRFLGKSFVKTIVVSTNTTFEPLVRKELEGFDVAVLVEPCRRNTAPAIGLAIRYLEECCNLQPNDPVLILPSDQLIEPESVFLDYLIRGAEAAVKGQVVTFGIRPTKPEIGYGYIRIGEKFDSFTYRVEKFVEKPDLAHARAYVSDPSYYWNSGVFAFTPSVFWAEAELCYPQICQLKNKSFAFQELDPISIDYALLEKAQNVVVCPVPVSWSDIGSWENVYEMLDKDKNQNVKIGQVVDIATKNCLIFGGKRVISTLGLEDLVIIDTDDALLIAKKSQSQQVRMFSE